MATPPYVTTGTTIDAAWGNQVAAALVNTFASTAARSAAISSPAAGYPSYISSNDDAEGLYFYNSAGAWRKDWSSPWGCIGRVTISADQTFTSTSYTDMTSSSLSLSLVDNRLVLVVWQCQVTNTYGGANDITFRLTDGTPTTILQMPALKLDNADYQDYSYTGYIAPSATGSVTYKLRAKVTQNGVTFEGATTYGKLLFIDVGPADAPA